MGNLTASQGGLSRSSPLRLYRLYGSRDGQVGGSTSLEAAKDDLGKVGKQL
jgi:hypothetical protein